MAKMKPNISNVDVKYTILYNELEKKRLLYCSGRWTIVLNNCRDKIEV